MPLTIVLLLWKGRPAHGASAEQVKMQVGDALSRIRANVGDKTVAALADAQVARNLCRRRENSCQYRPVLCCHVRHRGDVTPWDEQDVLRRLWVDVFKGDHILVLIDYFTRYHTRCNLAEQAVLNNHIKYIPSSVLFQP